MTHCQPKQLIKVYKHLLWALGLNTSCLLCTARAPQGQALCSGCCRQIHWLNADNCCPRCNLPGTHGMLCPACQRQRFHFDHCIAATSYQWPANHLLTEFKYRYRKSVLDALLPHLLQRLNTHYKTDWPDLLLSVPQHPKRLRERGFDQAALLAQTLSRRTGISYQKKGLKRTRYTPSQQALHEKARRKNMRRAFALGAIDCPPHVALIDDIVTSGATVDELARLLRRHGAKTVDIWALARTPQPSAITQPYTR